MDILNYINQNTNLNTEKKVKLLDWFCKQRGWTEKITDGEGKEIDNPVTQKECFNDAVQKFIIETAKAGYISEVKEANEYPDEINSL